MGTEEIRYAAPPQSRNESILAATIDGAEYTDPPQSRIEDLLLQLKAKIEQGGGGGTSDYDDLTNKPQINDVPLSGNKSGRDLGLQNALSFDSVPTDGSTNPVESNGVYTALDGKVDKVQGKGLSTEDFTAMYKAWLDVSMQSPLNHNGIFRGKDLTNIYTVNEMYSMINAGTFDDLFLGDYINVSITTTLPDETVKTETVSLMIAAFDYYYNCGDTALTTHHIVLIPRGYGFATAAKMNETNTTTGGYLNSYMHQTVLPCYADSLRTALNNHLLSHRTMLSNAVNTSTPSMAGAGMTGAASGWEWTTVELQLMNEVQVYGTTVWSSSTYDVGVDNRQLPVFKFINPVHTGRSNFWLRSIVSSTYFADCYTGGYADTSGASYARNVRPLVLFG